MSTLHPHGAFPFPKAFEAANVGITDSYLQIPWVKFSPFMDKF